jgi:hypothetical protein
MGDDPKRLTAENAEKNKNVKMQERTGFLGIFSLKDLIPLGAGRSLRTLRRKI